MKIGTINPSKLAENLTKRIEEDIAAQRVGCAAVAVSQWGKLLFRRDFGGQTPGEPQPLRPDAIFRIASMTKPITAVAALIQVERGKLSLEDPVCKYLPQYEIQKMAPADKYIIQHVANGRPSDYERVITYTQNGVKELEGWYNLRVRDILAGGEGR